MDLKWHSSTPTHCDICGREIKNEFVHGKTFKDSWGIFCPKCHKVVGVGLGVGRGQRYLLTNFNGEDVFLCISGSASLKKDEEFPFGE